MKFHDFGLQKMTLSLLLAQPVIPVELGTVQGTGYIIRIQLMDSCNLRILIWFFVYFTEVRKMQNVTMETDNAYAGEDLLIGTEMWSFGYVGI